jgi:cyclophilin family peptidyl-prolyl cis-trans isomerase
VGTAKRERQKSNRQIRLEELERQQRRARNKSRIIRWTVIIVIAGAAAYGISLLVNRNSGSSASSTTSTTAAPTSTVFQPSTVPAAAAITGETPCPKADGSSPRTISFAKAPPTCIDANKTYKAEVITNKGSFTMDLDPKKAPLAVNNFVVLSRYHYYDGVLCQRIITDFVVQCGDPSGTGGGTYPGYTFADELPKAGEYKVGSVAMANSGPNTNGSQFFIVTGDQGVALDPNYTLFGNVSLGMDTTVKALEATADPSGSGATTEPVYITSVKITEA